MEKKRLAILFGGRSAEHEVSVDSANNIYKAIDKAKYEVVIIGIDHKGEWYLYNKKDLNNLIDPDKKEDYFEKLAVIPGKNDSQFYNLEKNKYEKKVDVIFPVLHGPYGEDGTIQGLIKNIDTPFVGAGVLASAIAMDKAVMKRLLYEEDINTADYQIIKGKKNIEVDKIIKKLGLPLFVKPANLGSSVGVKKVSKKEELINAIDYALKFDNKVIVEEFINGREIECSVLGNEKTDASLPGEIIPQDDFYSYEAKYINEKGAVLSFPAELSDELTKKIKEISLKVYKSLLTEGMARVDCFLKEDGEIIVNEINTIPGFTKISMYPKLWIHEGISYSNLIDELINLATENFKEQSVLKSTL